MNNERVIVRALYSIVLALDEMDSGNRSLMASQGLSCSLLELQDLENMFSESKYLKLAHKG